MFKVKAKQIDPYDIYNTAAEHVTDAATARAAMARVLEIEQMDPPHAATVLDENWSEVSRTDLLIKIGEEHSATHPRHEMPKAQ